MRIAVAVGIAAAFLIAMVLLLRPRSPAAAPTALPLPPSAAQSPSPDLPPKAAGTLPGNPAAAPLPADPRRLLAKLAKALRDSDEKGAHEILKELHVLLYPPIPDDQNAALLYDKAFDLAKEKMGGLSMKGLDRDIYSAIISGKEITPEQTAALRAWFDKNGAAAAEVTALLREAAKRAQCRFPEGTSQRSITNLSYACNLLRVSALMEQQGGRSAEAADLTLAGLGMARAVRSTPDVISQLLSLSYDTMSLDSLKGPLSPGTPSIAAWLDRAEPASVRDAYLRALLGNVDGIVSEVLACRENPAAVSDEELRQQARAPLALQDLAAFVEGMNDFSRFAGRPYYECRLDIDTLARQHGELAPWYASLSQEFARGMPGLTRAIAKSEAQTSLAKLSLELDRYRERNGGYPASLDALRGPALRDPFTGQPFAYRREGSGFVLESPGGPAGKDALTWRSRN